VLVDTLEPARKRIGMAAPLALDVAAAEPDIGVSLEAVPTACELAAAPPERGLVARSEAEAVEVVPALPESGLVALSDPDALLVDPACPDSVSCPSWVIAPEAEDVAALEPTTPLEARATALVPEEAAAPPDSGLVLWSAAADVDDALDVAARGREAASVAEELVVAALAPATGFCALRWAEAVLMAPA
jgi:hypothetical protein